MLRGDTPPWPRSVAAARGGTELRSTRMDRTACTDQGTTPPADLPRVPVSIADRPARSEGRRDATVIQNRNQQPAKEGDVDEPIDIKALGLLVRNERERRGRLSLRAAAEQADVPFNTLARVEKGDLPDLANFRRIVAW